MGKHKKGNEGVPVRKASPSRASGVAVRSVAKKRPSPPARSRKEDPDMARRHAVYKKLLKELKVNYCCGLCHGLQNISSGPIQILPELMVQKPKNAYGYWWPDGGKLPRLAAVRKAIALSAPAKAIVAKPKAVGNPTGAKRSGEKRGAVRHSPNNTKP